MIELLSGQVETTQRSQGEYDDQFVAIAQLIDINSRLAALIEEFETREVKPDIFEPDLQAEAIAALTEQRDALLAEIMQAPEASFAHEFELLGRLYEGRTSRSTDSLGNVCAEFVTRDPARQRADLHFRYIEYAGGSLEQAVEVPGSEADSAPYVISLKGGLRIATSVYSRGQNHRIEIDPDGDQGARMLMNFFAHSITASDLMFNRTPDEIAQADAQAVRFLRDKQYRQRNY